MKWMELGCETSLLAETPETCQYFLIFFPIFLFLDTNLKLARVPARSPLPVAALPSMSLVPPAPFTNVHGSE
jgi:hypothetical protein